MAALEKVFSIKINGINQSISSVESLADALERLGKAAETEAAGEREAGEERKRSARTVSELEKTQQKYNEIMSESGAEIYRLKTAISEQRKALKDEMDLEKARQVVAEQSLGSYQDKQRMLAALGKVIRSTNAETEQEKENLAQMISQYKALNDELIATDESMGNHYRKVGRYAQDVGEPIVAQLKEMQRAMAEMLANGVQPTDEKFQELAQRAGKLKDAIGDANRIVSTLASDTRGLDQFVGGMKDATSVMGVYQGIMASLGADTAEYEAVMKKLVGIQTTLNSLQQVSNSLQNQSSLLFKAKTAIMKSFTTAQNGATVATKAFGVALKSIGIGLVLAAVAALVEYFDDIKEWVGDMIGGTDKLSKGWEKFMSVLKGVGNAVVQWVINPIKTAIETTKKLMDLDFSGAIDAVKNGAKRQFDVVGNFTSMYNKSQAKYAEERTRKQAAENAKMLKDQIDTNEARYGSDYKYTTEGKKLWENYYKALINSEKDGSEERKKAELDLLKFQRDIAKKSEDLKKQQIERAKKLNAEFDKAWESYRKETSKMSDDNVKSMLDADKKVLDAGKADTEKALNERRNQWRVYYASLDTIAEEEAEKSKTEAQKAFDELVKAARQAGKNVKKLQDELADRLFEIDQKLGQQLVQNQEALKAQLEKDQKELVKSQVESVTKMVEEGQASLKSRLETLQGSNLKNPTISMLKDMKVQYTDYLDDLEKEHERFVKMIDAEMASLNPDTEEYKKLLDKRTKLDKEYLNQRKAISTKLEDLHKGEIQIMKDSVDSFKETLGTIMDGVGEMLSMSAERLAGQIDAVGEKYDAISRKVEEGQQRIKELNDQLAEAEGASRIALQEEIAEREALTRSQMTQQEELANQKKELEQKKADIEYKQQKSNLTNTLIQSIAASAMALVQCFSQLGPIAGAIAAVPTAAMTAVQIATISKQLSALKPAKFERGGLIEHGNRHSRGGTVIEAEKGEYVMNRNATRRWLPLLDMLNGAPTNNPTRFERGGMVDLRGGDPVGRMMSAMSAQPIYVSVTDINRVNGRMASVRDMSRGA